MRPARLPTVIALLAAPALPACIPVVTHGPWVAEGTSVGAVASIATQPVLEGEVRTGQGNVSPVLPPGAVFARYGWTPEADGTPIAVSAGVSVPIALPFSLVHPEADLYAQLTPAAYRTAAAGAGVLVSRSYTTPYLQAGRALGEGASLYTTQSVAFFRGGDRGPDARVWLPSVALKAAGFHLFVQGGLGRERVSADSVRRVRFVMAGAVVEGRSLGQLPRIPPLPRF